jgi:hypothetical protein
MDIISPNDNSTAKFDGCKVGHLNTCFPHFPSHVNPHHIVWDCNIDKYNATCFKDRKFRYSKQSNHPPVPLLRVFQLTIACVCLQHFHIKPRHGSRLEACQTRALQACKTFHSTKNLSHTIVLPHHVTTLTSQEQANCSSIQQYIPSTPSPIPTPFISKKMHDLSMVVLKQVWLLDDSMHVICLWLWRILMFKPNAR